MADLRSFAKRGFDALLSLVLLLFLFPVLALIVLAIRMCLGSPVLFRQVRAGFRGKTFSLLKFRTMLETRDARGAPLPDRERLTRLGCFLRNTSVDELPELINVLRGEMSLVGPRPLLVQYLKRYTPEQMRRHEVKPGITGWAQVNGRNAITWEQRFAFDVWYVDHWSLWLDLKILTMTAWKIVRREGIRHPGEATMSEFMGTRSGTARDVDPRDRYR
jgi:sugar transferase EpsL